jgi:serpin B
MRSLAALVLSSAALLSACNGEEAGSDRSRDFIASTGGAGGAAGFAGAAGSAGSAGDAGGESNVGGSAPGYRGTAMGVGGFAQGGAPQGVGGDAGTTGGSGSTWTAVTCGAAPVPASGGFSGGAAGGGGGIDVPESRSSLPHDDTPDIDASARVTFVRDNTDFAFELARELRKRVEADDNYVFSPASISFAFGVASAGAKGQTLDEIRSTLHFTLPQPTVHAGFNWLQTEMRLRPFQGLATVQAQDVSAYSMDFELANTLFVRSDADIGSEFLDVLSTQYDGGVKLGLEVGVINAWVEQETRGRITDLLHDGDLGDDPRWAIVNAISMGAPWRSPFREGIVSLPFHHLDGSETTVDMMTTAEGIPGRRITTGDLDAVALPLLGEQLEVIFVLPAPGSLAAVEESMTGAALASLREGMQCTVLGITMPKAKITSPTLALNDPLKALGLKAAFGMTADFTGILPQDAVWVTAVMHKAMIGFDEKGIEAAAATAIISGGESAPFPGYPFVLDRPFLVGIRDVTTGALLFWGRIARP